ncbi:PREDICTED: ankyrin repeat domain-containing protein 10-like isoform X2 [Priapulus caudatus]|uniref:Ankyrin repeat domain-containing protein 10-like isoform X2 n=1 Tax=Priapulus caudatus TaxID=37621 RepID=A0ABM1F397_PRICU|nr:PREDICTED: ankyrin repeat domain-containing protein 10-like isoform X2 [Priapulus caudatus]XP_014678927.1 PREDICTED: ankyrin repeat domain-containing protein 10-like isoform X2 [Priapulus caudatus]
MEEHIPVTSWVHTSEDILRKQFPLHRLCRDGDVEALSYLLLSDSGQCDFYVEDIFYGWTPAHWSAYFGKLRCLMKLIAAGCHNDWATERFQQTPAHLAAFAGHTHCLKWLLHCGSLFNRQDYLNETPMHKAARSGSLECLSLLVAHGADTDIKNRNGHTPADLARMCNHQNCADHLVVARLCASPTPTQPTLAVATPTLVNGAGHLNGHQENGASGDGHQNGFSNGHCDIDMEDDEDAAAAVHAPNANGDHNGAMEHCPNGMEYHQNGVEHLHNGMQAHQNGGGMAHHANGGMEQQQNGMEQQQNGMEHQHNGMEHLHNGMEHQQNNGMQQHNGSTANGNTFFPSMVSHQVTLPRNQCGEGMKPYPPSVLSGDATIQPEICQNLVPITGRKRSREAADGHDLKRMRSEGDCSCHPIADMQVSRAEMAFLIGNNKCLQATATIVADINVQPTRCTALLGHYI